MGRPYENGGTAPHHAAPVRGERQVSAEQDEHGNGKADEARCFREGKAEEQGAALAGGGGRIAKCSCQVVAENCADANASATEGNSCNTCADHLCCFNVHFFLLWNGWVLVSGRHAWHR